MYSYSPSRKNRASLHYYTPAEYQDHAVNSLKIHQPSLMLPKFILAFIQHMVRSGALYPASQEGLDDAVGKHFGDGFAFPHLQTIFDLYDFRVKDQSDRVNVVHAAMLSLLLGLRSIFGLEGAFRFWCAIFEAAFTGVEVEFPDGAEPVAVLRLKDGQSAPGWDAEFPIYPLHIIREMEASVDEPKAMRYWQQSSMLPEASYPRVAMKGFMQLTHEMGPNREVRVDGYGDIRHSVAFEIANRNRAQLMFDTDQLNDQSSKLRSLFGEANVADTARAAAWSSSVQNLRHAELSSPPVYPLPDYSTAQLDTLAPIQRYGFLRANGVKHSGLDLPGATGQPIKAMYGGVVVGVKSDWTESEGSPTGNFVMIRTSLPPRSGQSKGDSFLHEYYHMSSVKKGLKRGDRVAAGDVIGAVGFTGNSTGPHLHLNTRWNRVDGTGRSERRQTIDPERVIRSGAIPAALESGLSFGSPARPHLSVPMFILGTIAGGSYSSPVPSGVSADYSAAVAAYLDSKKEASGEAAEQSSEPYGGLSAAQKSKLKQEAKKAAPAALNVALASALAVAGVPPEVATAAGNALQTVLQKNASGSPDEVMGAITATSSEWGVMVEDAERYLSHIRSWITSNL